MKKLNSRAFTIVEILVAVFGVALVVFGGLYLFRHHQNTVNGQATGQTKNSSQASSASTGGSNPNSQAYLVIPEWGIKVKLANADPSKLDYNLSGPTTGATGPLTATAGLILAPSVTTDHSCKNLGIEIDRGKLTQYSGDKLPNNVVGDYYYVVTGNPYKCGDDTLDALRAAYTGHSSSWQFLAS